MHTVSTSIDNRPVYSAVANGPGRLVVAVTCTKCGAREVGSDKPIAPIDLIDKHFAAKGWRVKGKRAVCPTCERDGGPRPAGDDADADAALAACDAQRQKTEAKMATQQQQAATTHAATGETIKAQAKMHRLLSEHFNGADDGRGAYDDGWDDARVECGLAVAEVSRTRDHAYGRLADAAVVALAEQLKAERARLDKDVAEVRSTLDLLQRLAHERLETLTAQVEALASRKPKQ